MEGHKQKASPQQPLRTCFMLIAIAQPSDIRKNGIEKLLLLLKKGRGISAEMHSVGKHNDSE